jgi:hypothetical protein
MAIIKEPKGVDFVVKSQPWPDDELRKFREIIAAHKASIDTSKPKNQSPVERTKPMHSS